VRADETADSAPVLGLHDVDLSFGDQRVLRGFSLTVRPGEKVLLYGESGTGKSSVLRLLLGFVQPDAGHVEYGGRTLDAAVAWQARQEIACVPQDLDIGEGSPNELLSSVREYRANRGHGISSGELDAYRRELRLDDDLMEKPFADLSGGEKQRVSILTALSLGRRIVFLDEATASLDDALKRRVVNLFAAPPDWTLIAVSHDPVWREHPGFLVVPFPGGTAGSANA
jgi:ABC-type multidrug transport system ATPase subunit